ncbi:Gfo/Idh/MocA family protein [Saccharospirillum impatiens]|uniref:Gfo/Idh/MocA family protein n=1 Tax=Saccharospirillum impatiens TaxID=169438 RepID=UPI00041BBFF8|nr:Gfo/Idh/MocA family oxidoreductase [Saccharospirillum impatiens]
MSPSPEQSTTHYRWAVIGTGGMADQFVADARYGQGGEFVAVCSRSQASAQTFADRHGIALAVADIDALLERDDIDVVYIASPHTHHLKQAVAAMEAGKAVLVEKPATLNAAQTRHLYETAERCQVLCVEALWTRFSPVYQSILADLESGRIGEVRQCQANFGFAAPADPAHRLNAPELAGGALLDIGIYPLLLPLDLFGSPESIEGDVTLGDSGVDRSADLVLRFADGARASLSYSLDFPLPTEAAISGDNGWVNVKAPWFATNAARWQVGDAPVLQQQYPLIGKGYHYEFSAVNRSLDAGLLQCEEHSWADSLALAEVMDRIRKRWGPDYGSALEGI